jgi:hypothetical protein
MITSNSIRSIVGVIRALGIALAFLQLAGAGSPALADKSAVVATWNEGYVSVVGNYLCGFARIGHPDTEKECLIPGVPDAKEPVPAVIFLHGCMGWSNRQARVMNLFKENGYVTFSPDSFARPGRKSKCGKRSRVTGLRLEEIRYAVKQIRKLPWVDQDRLVLAGSSEGGMAAARYTGNDFRAIVILAWGCGRGTINAPKSVPVLNLVGKDDKETPYGNVLCGVGGRPDSKAMHVDAGHEIPTDPAAYDIIGTFLEKVLK